MGESLGAVISLAALEKLPARDGNARTPVDKLVLLSPPFGSLQDTASKLREMSAQNQGGDQKFVYRVRQNGAKYNEFGSLQNIDGFEVFEKFAADGEKSRSLESRIDAIKNLPVHTRLFFELGTLPGINIFMLPSLLDI
jgi:pimeloyl-ACP methyl ester carboxylesterase